MSTGDHARMIAGNAGMASPSSADTVVRAGCCGDRTQPVAPEWQTRRRRALRMALRTMERLLALLGAFFLVYHAVFDLSQVVSASMAPTLCGTSADDGDYVLAEKLSYRFRDPRRWELVMFRDPCGTQVMKRVVGFPGERISCRDGRVVINGRVLEPPRSLPDLRYVPVARLSAQRETLIEGGYFVLGDNVFDSDDSRFEAPVPRAQICGRPWLIVWPRGRMRLL